MSPSARPRHNVLGVNLPRLPRPALMVSLPRSPKPTQSPKKTVNKMETVSSRNKQKNNSSKINDSHKVKNKNVAAKNLKKEKEIESPTKKMDFERVIDYVEEQDNNSNFKLPDSLQVHLQLVLQQSNLLFIKS